jgi:hypothetical protein
MLSSIQLFKAQYKNIKMLSVSCKNQGNVTWNQVKWLNNYVIITRKNSSETIFPVGMLSTIPPAIYVHCDTPIIMISPSKEIFLGIFAGLNCL